MEDINIDGLTYTFEKPEKYLNEVDNTNQQAFVDLNGSVVTVNNYTSGATGRTPIFIARAFINGTEIASGYIKLSIGNKVDMAKEEIVIPCGTIEYSSIGREAIKELAWEKINEFYSKHGLNATTFKAHYTEKQQPLEDGVTLDCDLLSDDQTSSAAAKLYMDPTQIKVIGLTNEERTAEVLFESDNKKAYPDLVIKFTYKVDDNIDFPELNENYLVPGEKDMVEVKGRIENDTWTMISGIKEHFKDYLSTYKLASNHANMYAELPLRVEDEDPFLVQHGAEIVLNGEDEVILAKKQDIQLTQELTDKSRDYVVNFYIVLANGEKKVMTYKVRFTTPFEVSVNAVELKTLASPTKADLAKAVVIKGVANEVIYEKGALVTKNAEDYAITDASYFSMVYGLSGSDSDSWESFGNRLTIANDGMITWNNEGALLQQDKTATSEVTVTVAKIAIMKATGTVTVLSSEHSKN